MFCALTRANQLWGTSTLLGGHCSEPQRGHDLWRLCLAGLLPLSWLPNEWDRWGMNQTAPLSSFMFLAALHCFITFPLLPFMPSFPPSSSSLLWPLFPYFHIPYFSSSSSSSSSTTHLFAPVTSSSTLLILSALLPRLRSLMNIKRRAPASSRYPTDFKHSAFSTSSSPTHSTLFISSCFKLCLSLQLLSYEYKQPC